MTDLNQLWMCGLPGYGPGDLIDLSFSEESIEVIFSAGMDRPLRLTSPEATAVLVALRALQEVPGMVDPQAARSAIAKIESAAGRDGRRPPTRQPPKAQRPRPSARRCGGAAHWRSSTTRRRTTRRRIGSSTRSGSCSSATRATWKRGAAAPRACGCSGSTASTPPRCSTSRRPRRRRPCRQGRTHRCSTPTRRCRRRRSTSRRPRAGCSTTSRCGWSRELPDGSCEAEMTYASEEWMARLVLGFGAAVKVLAPSSLAERVRTAAAAALQAYEAPVAAVASRRRLEAKQW